MISGTLESSKQFNQTIECFHYLENKTVQNPERTFQLQTHDTRILREWAMSDDKYVGPRAEHQL